MEKGIKNDDLLNLSETEAFKNMEKSIVAFSTPSIQRNHGQPSCGFHILIKSKSLKSLLLLREVAIGICISKRSVRCRICLLLQAIGTTLNALESTFKR